MNDDTDDETAIPWASATADCNYSVNEKFPKEIRGSSQRKRQSKAPDARGWVVVIINYKFPDPDDNLYAGTEKGKIMDLFSRYNYKVRGFTNLSALDMEKKIEYYASKKDSHSLVCFISSHGNSTSLFGSDGETILISEILQMANTRELRDKPKTFFFDACRSRLERDVAEAHIPRLPSCDYFVGFSCLDFKESAAKEGTCGIYFKALLSVFQESFKLPSYDKKKVRDIEYLVKKAHFRVRDEKDEHGRKKFQLPEYKSSIAGVYFLQGKK